MCDGHAGAGEAVARRRPARAGERPAYRRRPGALEAKEAAASLGDDAALEAAVEANPDDHQARIDLAVALNAKGEREKAVTHLIASIKKDRAWNDGAARKQLLQFFEAGAMATMPRSTAAEGCRPSLQLKDFAHG